MPEQPFVSEPSGTAGTKYRVAVLADLLDLSGRFRARDGPLWWRFGKVEDRPGGNGSSTA